VFGCLCHAWNVPLLADLPPNGSAGGWTGVGPVGNALHCGGYRIVRRHLKPLTSINFSALSRPAVVTATWACEDTSNMVDMVCTDRLCLTAPVVPLQTRRHTHPGQQAQAEPQHPPQQAPQAGWCGASPAAACGWPHTTTTSTRARVPLGHGHKPAADPT